MQYRQVEFGQASMITNRISSSHPFLKEADRREEGRDGGAESQGTHTKKLPKYASKDVLMSLIKVEFTYEDTPKSGDPMYNLMISVHLVNIDSNL